MTVTDISSSGGTGAVRAGEETINGEERNGKRPSDAHLIDITEDGFEITHPDWCEVVTLQHGEQDYDCLLSRIIRYEGFEEHFAQPPSPGRYFITGHAWQEPHGPTAGEWQSGIDLTPVEKGS